MKSTPHDRRERIISMMTNPGSYKLRAAAAAAAAAAAEREQREIMINGKKVSKDQDYEDEDEESIGEELEEVETELEAEIEEEIEDETGIDSQSETEGDEEYFTYNNRFNKRNLSSPRISNNRNNLTGLSDTYKPIGRSDSTSPGVSLTSSVAMELEESENGDSEYENEDDDMTEDITSDDASDADEEESFKESKPTDNAFADYPVEEDEYLYVEDEGADDVVEELEDAGEIADASEEEAEELVEEGEQVEDSEEEDDVFEDQAKPEVEEQAEEAEKADEEIKEEAQEYVEQAGNTKIQARESEAQTVQSEERAENSEVQTKDSGLKTKWSKASTFFKVETKWPKVPTYSKAETKQPEAESTHSKVEAKTSEAESTYSTVKSKNSEADSTYSNLEAKDSEAESTYSKLEAKDSEAESTYSKLEAKDSEAESTYSKLEAKDSEAESTYSKIEAKDSEVESTYSKVEAEDVSKPSVPEEKKSAAAKFAEKTFASSFFSKFGKKSGESKPNPMKKFFAEAVKKTKYVEELKEKKKDSLVFDYHAEDVDKEFEKAVKLREAQDKIEKTRTDALKAKQASEKFKKAYTAEVRAKEQAEKLAKARVEAAKTSLVEDKLKQAQEELLKAKEAEIVSQAITEAVKANQAQRLQTIGSKLSSDSMQSVETNNQEGSDKDDDKSPVKVVVHAADSDTDERETYLVIQEHRLSVDFSVVSDRTTGSGTADSVSSIGSGSGRGSTGDASDKDSGSYQSMSIDASNTSYLDDEDSDTDDGRDKYGNKVGKAAPDIRLPSPPPEELNSDGEIVWKKTKYDDEFSTILEDMMYEASLKREEKPANTEPYLPEAEDGELPPLPPLPSPTSKSNKKWNSRTEIASTLSSHLQLVSAYTVANNIGEITPLLTTLLETTRKIKDPDDDLTTQIQTMSCIRVLSDRLTEFKDRVKNADYTLRNADLSWLIRILCKISCDPLSKLRPEASFSLARIVKWAGPDMIVRPVYFILVIEDNDSKRKKKGARLPPTGSSKIKSAALDTLTYALLSYPKEDFRNLEEIAEWVCLTLLDMKRRVRQSALECLTVIAKYLGGTDEAVSKFRLFIMKEKAEHYSRSPSASDDSDPGGRISGRMGINSVTGAGIANIHPISAIQARLARNVLPLPSTTGLIDYAVDVPTGKDLILILTKMQEREEKDFDFSSDEESADSGNDNSSIHIGSGSESESARIQRRNSKIKRQDDLIKPDVAYILCGKGPVNRKVKEDEKEKPPAPKPKEKTKPKSASKGRLIKSRIPVTVTITVKKR